MEWDGSKSVLMEVPKAGPSRTNEVEMDGLTRAKNKAYDPLDDVSSGVWVTAPR